MVAPSFAPLTSVNEECTTNETTASPPMKSQRKPKAKKPKSSSSRFSLKMSRLCRFLMFVPPSFPCINSLPTIQGIQNTHISRGRGAKLSTIQLLLVASTMGMLPETCQAAGDRIPPLQPNLNQFVMVLLVAFILALYRHTISLCFTIILQSVRSCTYQPQDEEEVLEREYAGANNPLNSLPLRLRANAVYVTHSGLHKELLHHPVESSSYQADPQFDPPESVFDGQKTETATVDPAHPMEVREANIESGVPRPTKETGSCGKQDLVIAGNRTYKLHHNLGADIPGGAEGVQDGIDMNAIVPPDEADVNAAALGGFEGAPDQINAIAPPDDIFGGANAAPDVAEDIPEVGDVPQVEIVHPDSEESETSDNGEDKEFENQDVSIFFSMWEYEDEGDIEMED